MRAELKECPFCKCDLDYLPHSMRGVRDKEKDGKCWCWNCMLEIRLRFNFEDKSDGLDRY